MQYSMPPPLQGNVGYHMSVPIPYTPAPLPMYVDAVVTPKLEVRWRWQLRFACELFLMQNLVAIKFTSCAWN